MTKEKKNRIISIISLIVSILCLVITVFLVVRFIQVNQELNDIKDNKQAQVIENNEYFSKVC